MRAGTGLAAALAWLALAAGAPGGAAAAEPRTLEECYLNVAMKKSTADLVYLAREICDAVFKRMPRGVTVLDPKGRECTEWWFDERGRYEAADRYCAMEETAGGTWKLACQWKKSAARPFTFVELREGNGRYQPVSELRGKPVGTFFTGLASCVEHRAQAAGAP